VTAKTPTSRSAPSEASLLQADPRWKMANRIAASPCLSRATQLRDILLYIVNQTILAPDEPLRESEIAHKVLGRRADFNPLDDNIVRVQMAHLRKRLELYYTSDGKDEDVLLSIALGSYRPIFGPRPAEPGSAAPEPAEAPLAKPETPPPGPEPSTPVKNLWSTLQISAAVLVLLLMAVCVDLLNVNLQQRKKIAELQTSLSPWRAHPTVAAFWTIFFDSEHETDVIIGDDSLLLMEMVTHQYTNFTAYINHAFPSEAQKQGLSNDARQEIDLVASKGLGSTSEFKLAQKLLALDPQNKRFHAFVARQYPPAFLKQNNVILIGGRISNPWEGVFDSKLNFIQDVKFVDTGTTDVINRSPLAGEQKLYQASDNVGYCILAFLPDPTQNTNVLLMEGTGSEATEAAGDFLASEEQMAGLLRRFHRTTFPSFELLLKISQVRGTPLTATVEAFRIY